MTRMHEKAVISQIGVPDLDQALLQSVFNLSQELKQVYEPPRADETRPPDVVFVDADEPWAVQEWKELENSVGGVTGVMVTSGNKRVGSYLTVPRPLSFRKVMLALKHISSTAVPSGGDEAPGDRLSVLVVDDSLPVRKFMAAKLPGLINIQMSMDYAGSGEEAARKIAAAKTPYDVIFLDVVMPGVDGYKVCKWIKSKFSSQVVMLTSKKSPFDKVKGAMSGCDGYLGKPPDEKRLKQALEKVTKRVRAETPVRAVGV